MRTPGGRGRKGAFALISAVALLGIGTSCGSGPTKRAALTQATTALPRNAPGAATDLALHPPSTSRTTTTSEAADLSVPTVGPFPTVLPLFGAVPPVVLTASGVPAAVTGRSAGGYMVTTPCQEERGIVGATPVLAADVVVDPGHGGSIEDGAIGPHGLKEKDLNLAVASYLATDLKQAGLRPLLTRVRDYPMTVEARARIVRSLRPRAFVSIHHNAEPEASSSAPGTEAYYQLASSDSKRLSGLVWEEVTRALSPYRLAWVARRDAGAKPRPGEHGDDYYGILRLTHGTPATLAELAYITNASEEAALARTDVQKVEAAALARAVVRFLATNDAGSGYVEPVVRTEPAGTSGTRSPACTDPELG